MKFQKGRKYKDIKEKEIKQIICDYTSSTITEVAKCRGMRNTEGMCYTYGFRVVPVCKKWERRYEIS